MKKFFFAFVFIGCSLIFWTDGCHTYYPLLYVGSDSTDWILTSSFVLLNRSDCDPDQLSEAISYIASQRPEMILTIRSRSDGAFEFGETLDASLISCDDRLSKFKTDVFKHRLSQFGVDTASIPKYTYINFCEGAYNSMVAFSCRNYQDFDGYRGRVVIVGEMGSSNIAVVHDSDIDSYRVPYAYQGEEFIYATQLLAIILNSFVNKQLIVDMPIYITLPILMTVLLLLLVSGDSLLQKQWTLIVKLLAFKIVQVIVFVIVVLSLILASATLNYVCDFDLFFLSIFFGGEVSFWTLYMLYWLKSRQKVFYT
jgi:hypothetical protein